MPPPPSPPFCSCHCSKLNHYPSPFIRVHPQLLSLLLRWPREEQRAKSGPHCQRDLQQAGRPHCFAANMGRKLQKAALYRLLCGMVYHHQWCSLHFLRGGEDHHCVSGGIQHILPGNTEWNLPRGGWSTPHKGPEIAETGGR